MNLHPNDVIYHKKCGKELCVLNITDTNGKQYVVTFYRWCTFCQMMVKLAITQTDIKQETILA